MTRRKKNDHVTINNPKFNFTDTLFQAVTEEWDSRTDVSPPQSPILNAALLGDLSDLSDLASDLSDLSPLSTPSSSPNSSRSSSPHPSTGLDKLKPETAIAGSAEGTITSTATHNQTTTTVTDEAAPLGRNAKRKNRRHAAYRTWRKKARQEKRDAIDNHYDAPEKAKKKFVDTAVPIVTDFNTKEAPVASTGYVGLDSRARSKKIYTLEELVGEHSRFKFRLVKWDGRQTKSILDKDRRIVAILAGHPEDPDWTSVHKEAAEALEARRSWINIPKNKRQHRRGAFPALRCGVSHGGGQRRPGNLQNNPINEKLLQELNNLKPFQRIAGFASSVMATWTPGLHKYYSETIDDLHASDPSLLRIFPSSVFCAASYNFGPRTVCFQHKDFGNLPFGLCAVTSLGTFDPTKGGHLILWEFGLVIEFPPGSTILLPSAIITHSNAAIDRNERRYSFAQYTAGGVFRWIDNHCKTRETYLSSLSAEEREADNQRNQARWAFGLSLFPKLPKPKRTPVACQ